MERTPYLNSRNKTKVIAPTMSTNMAALMSAPSNLVPAESESCADKRPGGLQALLQLTEPELEPPVLVSCALLSATCKDGGNTSNGCRIG